MNDSFLDELGLSTTNDKATKSQLEFRQHVTSRGNYITSTPEKITTIVTPPSTNSIVSSNEKKKHRKPSPIVSDKHVNAKLPPKPDRKSCTPKVKHPNSKKEEAKTKMKVLNNKENLKESHLVEKLSKESSTSSDVSCKENNCPLDTPASSKGRRDRSRSSDVKRPILSEPAEVATFITMIKDLISTYTKAESEKIMRCLAELHVESKANLLQQLFYQTDDLLEELQPSKDTNRLRALVSENEKLREDIMILQMRNEELKKRVQETMQIKMENIELKMKLKELRK